jgi:hypothetical protein
MRPIRTPPLAAMIQNAAAWASTPASGAPPARACPALFGIVARPRATPPALAHRLRQPHDLPQSRPGLEAPAHLELMENESGDRHVDRRARG